MSSKKIGARRVLGRGGWWGVAFWAGMGAANVTSCLEANRGHCLYEGGDDACVEKDDIKGICLFASSGGRDDRVGDDGCFYAYDDSIPDDPFDHVEPESIPRGFFHAQYGLPTREEAENLLMDPGEGGGSVGEMDSAQASVDEIVAIRTSFMRGGCSVEEENLQLDLKRKSCFDLASIDREQWTTDERHICDFYSRMSQSSSDSGTDTDPDADTNTATSSDTATTEDTATSSGSTTGPECTGTGEDECMDDSMRPFCHPMRLTCVSCDEMPMPDVACAERDSERPWCVEGWCVSCTAEDATVCTKLDLGCNPETGECVPCTEHAQCENGACDLMNATCFPEVVHVDGDGGRDYLSVVAAVNAMQLHEAIVVHEQGVMGETSYQGAPLINGGRTLALVAAPGERPILQGTGGNPGLRVEDEGTVAYVEGLALANNASGLGLSVTDATAWVGRSRIVQNAGGGIVAEGESAVLMLHNSFVGANGAGGIGSYGIEVNGAEAHVLYTTVARNDELTTDSIRCMDGTVDVRNSIVVGRDANSIDCPGIVITHSALDEDVGDEDVEGNVNVGAAGLAWFESATTGDFHLTPMGAMVFADIMVVWQTGDPSIDIDGDDRPNQDGVDYPGADVP